MHNLRTAWLRWQQWNCFLKRLLLLYTRNFLYMRFYLLSFHSGHAGFLWILNAIWIKIDRKGLPRSLRPTCYLGPKSSSFRITRKNYWIYLIGYFFKYLGFELSCFTSFYLKVLCIRQKKYIYFSFFSCFLIFLDLTFCRQVMPYVFQKRWLLIALCHVNPLSANFTKWPNTLKQFVGNFPTNSLSVFDHFVGLALKGWRLDYLIRILRSLLISSISHRGIRKR